MIVLSNALSDKDDEGSLKVAVSLVRRIKQYAPETKVISYERCSGLSDVHLKLNKLLLSPRLIRLLGESRESVLYVPFPTRILPAALRIFILSRFAGSGLKILLVMSNELDKLSAMLLKASGGEVLVVSAETHDRFRAALSSRVGYLKAGVDTGRFIPVAQAEKKALRRKYALPEDKPIVLHVGHMKQGRNVGVFLNLEDCFHGLIVVSTLTADERDMELRRQLEARPNITVIDSYLENIEEVYQLADVYLFPVTQQGHCIDAPLSAFEAAACGIPVAATPYGELQELLGCDGFYRIDSFEAEQMNSLLKRICDERKNPRESVLEYDWDLAVAQLLSDEK